MSDADNSFKTNVLMFKKKKIKKKLQVQCLVNQILGAMLCDRYLKIKCLQK